MNKLLFIGGPCVIESEQSAMAHASAIKDICARLDVDFIYKSSYDKANRTSGKTYRGPGLNDGLLILHKIKQALDVKILTDVHSVDEVKSAAVVVDVLQIPALLCRQTDLVLAASRATAVHDSSHAGQFKTVNIKKGQFMDPMSMKHILDKAESTGNPNIWLCERGTTFGYNNLVVDMRSIPIMKSFGCKVIIDAGHAVQQPGGLGNASGGMRDMIPTIAKCGIAAGADGLFIEVHENPDAGLSDGPNMLRLDQLESLLRQVKAIQSCL